MEPGSRKPSISNRNKDDSSSKDPFKNISERAKPLNFNFDSDDDDDDEGESSPNLQSNTVSKGQRKPGFNSDGLGERQKPTKSNFDFGSDDDDESLIKNNGKGKSSPITLFKLFQRGRK